MSNYEDEEFSFTEHLRKLAREEPYPVDEPDQSKRVDEMRILHAMYREPARSFENRNKKWTG